MPLLKPSSDTVRRSLCACLLTLACVIPGTLYAETDLQVSGFGTLGLSVETEDDMGFLRDSNQSKDPEKDGSIHADSILGLQLSSRFAEDWRATTQFVYRDRPEQGLEEATELAFIGYRPAGNLDLRAGRMAVGMFQLSDYRRVDYVNLWVRPPTEVYAWILPSYIDGADAAYSFAHGDYFWRLKVQYGDTKPVLESPSGEQQFDTEFNDFLVGTLTLDFGNWRTRLSYSQSKTAASVPGFVAGLDYLAATDLGAVGQEAAELGARLRSASGKQVRYTQASASYDNGDLIVDTEIARLSTSGALVPTGIAGYISVGHRFDSLTPYMVYSRFDSDQHTYRSSANWFAVPPVPAGPTSIPAFVFREAALGSLNGVMIEQYTHSLGVRWDVAPKIALKAQWDRSYVEAEKFAIWAHRDGRASSDAKVDIFSAALNFIF